MAYKNTYEDLLRDMEQNNIQFSDYDMALAEQNPDAGRSLYSQKVAYGKAATDEERTAANHAAEQIRQKYGGYTAGSDGTGFTLSDKYAPQPTPYVSQYQGRIDALLDQVMNREPFSYNPASDPSYQAYGEQYRNLGNKAMQNALGSAAAMTGGQLSSYAMTAAQQAQNDHNAQLSNAIPELQQLAYEMYLGEGNQMRQNLSTLMDLDATAYNRHQNEQADALNTWQLNYGVDRDLISDQRYQDQLAYDRQTAQEQRDYERGVYADQRDYERGVYADERDYQRALDKAQLLGAAGNFSGYQALGFTDADIQSLAKAYAAANVKSSGGGRSSSGSSGSSGLSGSGKPRLTPAQTLDALEAGYINDDTLYAFEYWFGQPYQSETSGAEESEEKSPESTGVPQVELTGSAKELDGVLSQAAQSGASVEELLDVVIGEQRRGKLGLLDAGRLFKKYTGK